MLADPVEDDAVSSPADAAGHEPLAEALVRARALAQPAHGRAAARERDPLAARAAQARPQGGRISIHTLILSPPKYLETAKVLDLLMAVPKYGRVKANKVLGTCRISPSKTIGGLSARQRDELVAALRR
jgi:hypothetical protein